MLLARKLPISKFPIKSNFQFYFSNKSNCVKISKATDNDFERATFLMNEYFFDDPLCQALKVRTTTDNKNVLAQIWMSLLSKNLSFKSFYESQECNFNGICINSEYNQSAIQQELETEASKVQCQSLKNLLLAWCNIAKHPREYEKDLKIFEIAGMTIIRNQRQNGIADKLVAQSLNWAAENDYDLVRIDCTSPYSAKICEKHKCQLVRSLPFQMFDGINLCDTNLDCVRIYEKELCKNSK